MATDDPKTRRQPPHVQAQRQILNEHWPVNPQGIRGDRLDARPVRARVVFDCDGETWLEGTAVRWDDGHVWFEPSQHDERFVTNGVWLKWCDVYRMWDESMLPEK